jgi:hypothetical protein
MAKKKITPKATDIIVVLDRSGSMQSIGTSTVDGFNLFIKEQKAAKGEATITLVQFDNEYQIDYKNQPINETVDLILGETFVPRAMTALFDAVGRTINEIDTKNDVVFVIVTDGMENASREFDKKTVFEMIKEKETKGWNFIFLGANQDAIKAGGELGIKAGNSMTYNANNGSVNAMYTNLSSKIGNFRSSKMNVNITQDSLANVLEFTENDRKEVNK